ncbi:MAG: UPF0175 family protein [Anaerolineae bacterium]|nr:UPF0175 family protein [Anaerolineae bacterium]
MKAHNKIELPRDELERLYVEENLSSNEIARLFGCDGVTVRARLREYGIPLRPRGWHKLVRRVPDQVLEAWPSPELAYVVGLVASDGSLQKQNNCMQLVSTEREIVDNCATLLCLDDPHIIVWDQGFPRKTAFMLQVCDHVFREFLQARGLTPNKTMTIGALDIPDIIFRDFLRGELDGDGSWYVAKGWRGSPYLVSKFVSRSQSYLEWIHRTVWRLTGIDGCLHGSGLIYNGKKAELLGQWIYYAPDLPCLRRKHDVWQNWMLEHSDIRR